MSSPPTSPCCDVQQWRGFVSGITSESAFTNLARHQESVKASMPPCRRQSDASSVQFQLPPFISGMRTCQRPGSVGRIGTQGEQDEAAKPEVCVQEKKKLRPRHQRFSKWILQLVLDLRLEYQIAKNAISVSRLKHQTVQSAVGGPSLRLTEGHQCHHPAGGPSQRTTEGHYPQPRCLQQNFWRSPRQSAGL